MLTTTPLNPDAPTPDTAAKRRGIAALARLGAPAILGLYFAIASATTPRSRSYIGFPAAEILIPLTGLAPLFLAVVLATRVVMFPTSSNRRVALLSWLAFALITPVQLWLLFNW